MKRVIHDGKVHQKDPMKCELCRAKPNPYRVLWRDFVHTRAWRALRIVLRAFKYKLVVEFDDQKRATDVYIEKV